MWPKKATRRSEQDCGLVIVLYTLRYRKEARPAGGKQGDADYW